MQTAIITRPGMALEEYLRRYEAEGPFEIIDGKVEPMSPTVSGHSHVIRLLFRTFDHFLAGNPAWELFTETVVIKPGADNPRWVDGSLAPDVALLAAVDVAAFKAANADWRDRPFPIVPALVIEVVSPTDPYSKLLRKVADYLDNGVAVVLVVNPHRKTITIYLPDQIDNPRVLGMDDVLTLDNLLPGFQLAVRTLFED